MTKHDAWRTLHAQLLGLAIVGTGRAGSSIARAARAAGIDVHRAGREDVLDACRRAEAALLCVPPLRFVGHVSGASGLDALSAAGCAGAATFSLHPLQTLPDGNSDLGGAACAVAGSTAEATGLAEALARALGLRPFAVAEEHRAAYHAAAAIGSNFLVAVMESANELLDRIGVEAGRELLAPLVLRTAANWTERAPAALTGPIARGDGATVERHRAAIAHAAPELLELYDVLAERTGAIA